MRRPFLLLALLLIVQQTTSQSGVWIGVGYSAEAGGIRVANLPYGSPAEKAGIRIGDLIVAMDAQPFAADRNLAEQQFRDFVATHAAGDEIPVRVVRDSNPIDVRVKIERRPLGVGLKTYSKGDQISREFSKRSWPEEELALQLIQEFKINDDYMPAIDSGFRAPHTFSTIRFNSARLRPPASIMLQLLQRGGIRSRYCARPPNGWMRISPRLLL
jgi:hypothetical protein